MMVKNQLAQRAYQISNPVSYKKMKNSDTMCYRTSLSIYIQQYKQQALA